MYLYLQGYDFAKCFDKICEECSNWECIHFTPEEYTGEEEEYSYRLATPKLDNTTEEMLKNMLMRLRRLRNPIFQREIYIVFKIFWSLGYNLRDIYYYIKDNWSIRGPVIIDQLMFWALPDRECLKYYFEDEIEEEFLEEEEIEDGRD